MSNAKKYEIRKTFISMQSHYGEAWIIYNTQIKERSGDYYFTDEISAQWRADRLNGIEENSTTINTTDSHNDLHSNISQDELGEIDWDAVDPDFE